MNRHLLPIATFVVLLLPGRLPADDKGISQPARPQSSLDDELLKDLNDKPAEGLGDKSRPAPAPREKSPTNEKPAAEKPESDKSSLGKSSTDQPVAKPAPERNPEDPLDQELNRSLGGGEDIGTPGEDDPMGRIVRRMRTVQERLAAAKSDEATHKEQQKISDELSSLLEQLEKQQQSSASSSSKQPSSSRAKPSSSQPGQPNGKPSNQPAATSSNQLRHDKTTTPAAEAARVAMRKALDRLNLPEKQREQMLQSPPDEFLPDYDALLKKYFERLTEEDSESP